MYFIASGVVTVKGPAAVGPPILLTRGDFFGEMALVLDQPRQADVIALSYCQLLVLERRDFQGLVRSHRAIRTQIERAVADRAPDERGAPGEPAMTTTRLEAFSDGVIAILITIMVLELKPPEGADLGRVRRRLIREAADVHPELRLPRHLLEQPSPHAPRHEARQRQDSVGQSASALLAVARAAHDGVAGIEPATRRSRRPRMASCCSAPRRRTRSCRTRSSSSRGRTPRSPRPSAAIGRA